MVISSIQTDTMHNGHCNVAVESTLRMRPWSKREREDTIVLEQVKSVSRRGPASVALKPLHNSLVSPTAGPSSLRNHPDCDTPTSTGPTEYHFNHVMSENTSQDKVYYTLGLPLATVAMNSLKSAVLSGASKETKSHLIVCMGVAQSGKSYTCFGGSSIPKRRAAQDGLVPRIVDSMFSQSKHHSSNLNQAKGFSVEISMAQVAHCKGSDPHACNIQDLLTASKNKRTSPKRILTVRSMAAKFERAIPSPIRSPLKAAEFSEVDVDDIRIAAESCKDIAHAREILQKGLNNSAKAARGQARHLLVTMQPTFNGNIVGDRVAILDMAGLEKGKKNQNRGKDSVANKNQAANAAVLHCLRTMIHNTNVRNGKTDTVDIVDVDDLTSEISCVSQEKDPIQRHLKPVPFRQHKVTMLLQSLFTSTTLTKVNLLMAAYSGHADYYEKRLLLQDTELLCGAALQASKATVSTGLTRAESFSGGSVESNSILTRSTKSEDDDGSLENDRISKPSFRAQPHTQRPSVNSLGLSASIDEQDSRNFRPAPFAPVSTKPSLVPQPSAPSLEVPQPTAPIVDAAPSRHVTPPKNPKYMSDFPGVDLATRQPPTDPIDPIIQRQQATTVIEAANVGGRNATIPISAHVKPIDLFDEKASRGFNAKSTREPDTLKKTQHSQPNLFQTHDSRLPLGRSSLENVALPKGRGEDRKKTAARQKMRQLENTFASTTATEVMSQPRSKQAPVARVHTADFGRSKAGVDDCSDNSRSHHISGSRQEATPYNPGDISKQRDNDGKHRAQNDRVQELESQVKELLRQRQALEKRCQALEKENCRLKASSGKGRSHNDNSTWTEQDEEDFQRARQLRIEDQTLIKASLRTHMERVNKTYNIKNQRNTTGKPHFGLLFPNDYKRASELDFRDKEYQHTKEKDAEKPPSDDLFGAKDYSERQKVLEIGATTCDNDAPNEVHDFTALRRLVL